MANNTIKFTFKLNVDGKEEVVSVSTAAKELQDNLRKATSESDAAKSSLIKWNQAAQAIQNIHGGMEQLAGVMHTMTSAYSIQEEAELKLETVMRQRMGATDDMVDSIKKLASEQQAQGVIGDEVQLAGAQQVATFLNEKSSIEKLLPAMNNLAVQRKGLNVTSEDMVNIGNLVGKVMQGQIGALTRVGITFTDAQKRVLKYGDESQRAAMLAEVITDNVGNMNSELAKTDAGKAKQMANDFGDLQENIGRFFSQYETYLQGFSQLGIIASGLGSVTTALTGMMKALGITTLAQKGLNAAWAWGTKNIPILKLAVVEYTAAQAMEGKGAIAAAASTTLFSTALRGLLIATGIGAAVVALGLALDALTGSSDTAKHSLDQSNDSVSETADVAAEARDQIASQIGAYQQAILKTADFKGSKDEEKKIVADLNSTYGDTLGTYQTVSDWYTALTDNSKAYTEQLLAQAKMQILVNRAAKNQLEMDELEREDPTLKGSNVTIGGRKVTLANSSNYKVDTKSDRAGGVSQPDFSHIRFSRDSTGKVVSSDLKERHEALAKAIDADNKEIESIQKDMDNIHIRKGSLSGGRSGNSTIKGGGSRVTNAPVKTENVNPPAPEGSIAAMNKQLDELRKKREQLTDVRDIADVDTQINKLKDDIDNLNNTAGQIAMWGNIRENGMKSLNVNKNTSLGTIMPEMKVPMPDDKAFKDEIDALGDKLKRLREESKQSADDMDAAMEGLRQSLGGDVSSTISQWQGIGKAFSKGGDAATGAGAAIASVGQVMQQVGGDGAAAKIGAIAAAIGQLVLGFATASAQAGGLGPFGWLGFTLAGAGVLATVISQVQSFSTGGIVSGTSYHGDNVPARVNSGEMILTMMQQKKLFDIANGRALPRMALPEPRGVEAGIGNVNSMLQEPMINVSIDWELKGTKLKAVQRNTELVYGKIGKNWR